MKYQFTDKFRLNYLSLLNLLILNKEKYNESSIGIFTPAAGINYNNSLMVVGIETNSWRPAINKDAGVDVELIIGELEDIFNTKGLQWIIAEWNKPYKQSSRRSSFLWVMKELSDKLNNGENDLNNMNKIIWSNLYKAAPEEAGNPSTKLQIQQADICKKILFDEIELFNPRVVVFLTGMNWAGSFLTGITNRKEQGGKFVEFVGKYNSSIIIVAKHPAYKPKKIILDEILNEIDLLKINK